MSVVANSNGGQWPFAMAQPLVQRETLVPSVAGASLLNNLHRSRLTAVTPLTAAYTAQGTDHGTLFALNSSSPLTLTLPTPPPWPNWRMFVQNIGSASWTIAPNGLNIDGASASLTVTPGTGVMIGTDGNNYFTCRGAATGSSVYHPGYADLAIVSNAVSPDIANGHKWKLVLNQAAQVTINNIAWTGGTIQAGDEVALYVLQDSTGGRPNPVWGPGSGNTFGVDVQQLTGALAVTPSTRSVVRMTYHDDNLWHIDSWMTGEHL